MKKLIALVALAACLLWPARSQAMYVDGMGLYQYVRSNPQCYVDINGNDSQSTTAPTSGPTSQPEHCATRDYSARQMPMSVVPLRFVSLRGMGVLGGHMFHPD